MTVSAISPTVEMGTKSYFEQINTISNKSFSHDPFRQNFLNAFFSSKQNLLTSGSYNHLSVNAASAEKYKEYKKLFQPDSVENSTGSSKSDAEKVTVGKIDEYSEKLAREIELSTMNQLVFSVSTRFGSAINQMVRGQ